MRRVTAADGDVARLLSAIDIQKWAEVARRRVDVAEVREWLNKFNPAFVLIESSASNAAAKAAVPRFQVRPPWERSKAAGRPRAIP